MAEDAAAKKPLTKTELIANIAAAADVPAKQVAAVLDALAAEIKTSLGTRCDRPRVGEDRKEDRSVRRGPKKGVPNPFKPGELMDRPAKPASHKITVRARAAQGHGEGVAPS